MSAFEGIATVGAARLDLEIVEAVGFYGRAARPVGPPAMPTCERSIGTAARRDGPYARGVVPILPADSDQFAKDSGRWAALAAMIHSKMIISARSNPWGKLPADG
jgi:hypothetical protein